jgi:hypothetical protein
MMAHDSEEDPPVEGGGQRTGGAAHFQRLPTELKGMVFDHLQSDDVRETARNIGKFRRISKIHDSYVLKTSSAISIRNRLNELRGMAEYIWGAVLKDGLSSEQKEKYDFLQESSPVPAFIQVQALTPTLVLQSAEIKHQLAQDVLKIANSTARAESIEEISRHLEHFSAEDRSLLIGDAIEILADRGHPLGDRTLSALGPEGNAINDEGGREAAMAIEEARAGGYLTVEHEERMDFLNNGWEAVSDLLARQRLRRKIRLSRAAEESASATAPASRPYEDRMKELHTSLDYAASDAARKQDPEGDPHGHSQMRALRDVALSIGAEVKALSSELDERSRTRGERSL